MASPVPTPVASLHAEHLRPADTRLTARCFCGRVVYSIPRDAKPMFQMFCHCEDCRAFYGAPYVASVGFEPGIIRIDEGEELLTMVNKRGTLERSVVPHCGPHLSRALPRAHGCSARMCRFFCSRCGTPIYNSDTSGAAGPNPLFQDASPWPWVRRSRHARHGKDEGSESITEGLVFTPTMHVNTASRIVPRSSLPGLPLFVDMPEDMGGSGRMEAE